MNIFYLFLEYSQGIILPSRNGNIAPAVVDTKNKEVKSLSGMNVVFSMSHQGCIAAITPMRIF